jgi:hypothetical protein
VEILNPTADLDSLVDRFNGSDDISLPSSSSAPDPFASVLIPDETDDFETILARDLETVLDRLAGDGANGPSQPLSSSSPPSSVAAPSDTFESASPVAPLGNSSPGAAVGGAPPSPGGSGAPSFPVSEVPALIGLPGTLEPGPTVTAGSGDGSGGAGGETPQGPGARIAAVPEPASVVLLAIGLCAGAARRHRRRDSRV